MNETVESMRDRRKIETMSLIHDVAQELALTRGLADAKVEEIAASVGISRRTFFNYFPTKEDAVLGLQAPLLPHGASERFAASTEDSLTRTTQLVMEVMRTTSVTGSSAAKRKELRRRFPELTQRFIFRAHAAENLVRPVVREHLSAELPGSELEQETDALLGLSEVIIRHAFRQDSEIQNDSLRRSLQLFKSTLRKVL